MSIVRASKIWVSAPKIESLMENARCMMVSYSLGSRRVPFNVAMRLAITQKRIRKIRCAFWSCI